MAETTTEQAGERTQGTIYEAGNGLAAVGELVYSPDTNTVYEIVEDASVIMTGPAGCANHQEVYLVEAEKSDPTEYSDDEWEEISDNRLTI